VCSWQLVVLIAMTMVGSRVVVSVAVDDVSVETVLVGMILDGPHVAARFLQGVLAHHLVTITGLLLAV
jgi:hypothetical protein